MEAHIQEFLDHLTAEKGCSDNTVAAYRNDLSQFYEYVSQKAPDPLSASSSVAQSENAASAADTDNAWSSLTRDGLIEYILRLKEREYASATVAAEGGGRQVVLPLPAERRHHCR